MNKVVQACEQEILWVTTDADLKERCVAWRELSILALDTEFIRTNTYYPKSALIQVNDGRVNYLIDPLTIEDWTPFKGLLQDAGVKKVLHACSEDLEVFSHLFGCLPNNFLDTQVASAFCGFGFSVGYAGIVEAIVGVVIPKGETRSNWLQRPLTESQIQYAALDVEYLYRVAEFLLKKLDDNEKRQWVEEECLSLLENYSLAQDPSNSVSRFKGAWRLKAPSFQVLKALSSWREVTAQERDLPRNFVIKEKALYQIAEIMPSQMKQFKAVDELSEKSVRRYGETLLNIIKEVDQSMDSINALVAPKPLSSAQKTLVRKMREQLQSVAKTLGIAPEYLARKKDFEYMARSISESSDPSNILPSSLKGWREPLVKKTILALI